MFYFFPISLPALKKRREAPQRIRIFPAVFLANRLSLPKDRLLRCIGGRPSFAPPLHSTSQRNSRLTTTLHCTPYPLRPHLKRAKAKRIYFFL